MTKLNPCPLCGNEPELTVYSGCINGVVCECGLAVEVGATTGDAAINGWNDVTANFTQPVKTLRDEFAMRCPFTSEEASRDLRAKGIETTFGNISDWLAAANYIYADAMLKERSK